MRASTAQLAFALAMIVTMGGHPGDAHRNASLAPWEKVLADAPWAPRDSAGFYVGANGALLPLLCGASQLSSQNRSAHVSASRAAHASTCAHGWRFFLTLTA